MENVFEHDAIPTWSGFIYQGRIAAYLAIKKIIELRDDNKVSEVDKYAIEMEKCEDIAIVYQCEKEKREYISIHQVKNEKENALGAYKKPLIQLMLEKGYYTKDNGDAPDAYLHIANRVRIQNKDFETEYLENIKNWKQKILNYYNAVDEACKNFTYNPHFYEELLKAIDTEPIGIDRSEYKKRYNAVITYCKKVMENNDSKDILKLKEELENLKDYLLNKFAVPNISNEVTIYEYDTGLKYFDATKIFDEIVGLVEKYKGTVEGWSKEQYKYLADKILNYIDKTILERHKKLQENNGVVKEISLSTIKDIMDSVIENNEKEANVLALKRGYIETLEKFCEKCKRSNDYTCQDIGCKLQQVGESQDQIRRYIRLTELIPEILEMVDDKKISMRPAVELSYLQKEEQAILYDTMESEVCTPSHAQAIKIRKFSAEGRLNEDVLLSIMSEEKPNQVEQWKIPKNRLKKYFPSGTTQQKMEETIIKALELYRKREKSRER